MLKPNRLVGVVVRDSLIGIGAGMGGSTLDVGNASPHQPFSKMFDGYNFFRNFESF